MNVSALITDFYELTMIQGYYLEDNNPDVVFDMFYRSQPFNSGYAVFCGLHDLLKKLENFHFSDSDIDFLKGLGLFRGEFLEFLKNFSFSGDIYAMEEGTIVFPGETLIRIHSSLIEAQLIESILLNIINFQTLIATKTSRILHASKHGKILEFGLRRAQGLNGALSSSRAAFIGGAAGTSNTYAGKEFSIPVLGTMAHSWVMAFDNELDSFRAYAKLYPDNCILLIDTYDTLGTGIKNAIIVGKEMKAEGKNIGVRIDSGDLSYLSKQVREMLDDVGLFDTVITVSNDLTEEIIHQLITDNAPIDSWGVGTHLVTGGSCSALNGVYKLAAKHNGAEYIPTMKVSNNIEKTTIPGIKQVYRFYSGNEALGDIMCFDFEKMVPGKNYIFYDPVYESKFFSMRAERYDAIVPLLRKQMISGKALKQYPSLQELKKKTVSELKTIHQSYKRIINPHIYKVSISKKIRNKKNEMIKEYRNKVNM